MKLSTDQTIVFFIICMLFPLNPSVKTQKSETNHYPFTKKKEKVDFPTPRSQLTRDNAERKFTD